MAPKNNQSDRFQTHRCDDTMVEQCLRLAASVPRSLWRKSTFLQFARRSFTRVMRADHMTEVAVALRGISIRATIKYLRGTFRWQCMTIRSGGRGLARAWRSKRDAARKVDAGRTAPGSARIRDWTQSNT